MPVLNIEKLIRAKEYANRPKDIEVLHELRAVRALELDRERGLLDLAPDVTPSMVEPDVKPLAPRTKHRGR